MPATVANVTQGPRVPRIKKKKPPSEPGGSRWKRRASRRPSMSVLSFTRGGLLPIQELANLSTHRRLLEGADKQGINQEPPGLLVLLIRHRAGITNRCCAHLYPPLSLYSTSPG